MRKVLEHLSNDVDRIDTNNIYEAINNIKEVLQQLIKHIDTAMPLDVEPD